MAVKVLQVNWEVCGVTLPVSAVFPLLVNSSKDQKSKVMVAARLFLQKAYLT